MSLIKLTFTIYIIINFEIQNQIDTIKSNIKNNNCSI